MKMIKKCIAVLLAAVMVLAMGMTAFAEDGKTGTITVKNPTANETYTVYKVFDLAYQTVEENGETSTVVAYTYNKTGAQDGLYNALKNGIPASGENEAIESPFNLTETVVPNAYNVTLKENVSTPDVVRFLSALVKNEILTTAIESKKAEAVTDSATGETSVGAVKFENLDYGYYYVTSSLGAVVSLTSTMPEAEIVDKNEIPFDKTVDDNSVELGQTVTFKIQGEVPDYTGFETYTYQITDKMSEGLTFNKDVKVTVGGKVLNENDGYTVKYTDSNGDDRNGFELTINVLEKEMNIGDEITVTYTAVVNENAVSVISKNDAKLTYSNDPTDSNSHGEKTDEEELYSAKIVIDKYDSSNQEKLSGAEFVLYRYAVKNSDGSYSFTQKDDVGNVSEVDKDAKDAVKVYYQQTKASTEDSTDVKINWTETQSDATVMRTDKDGAAKFPGLEDGKYYLLETKAPAGYNMLKEPVPVVINGKNATVNSLTYTEAVENSAGTLLPSTGGIGTTIFYVLGAILVIGAGILLVVRRCMRAGK